MHTPILSCFRRPPPKRWIQSDLHSQQDTGGGDKEGSKKKGKSSEEAPTPGKNKTPTAVALAPEGGGAPPLVIEEAPGSFMYGPVVALTSTNADAQETLEHLESIFPTGYAAILPHNRMETNVRTVKGNTRLTTRTGMQRVASSAKDDKKAKGKTATPSAKSLATIFELELDRARRFDSPAGHPPHTAGDTVVARAVIAFRDATGWASLGPTVQSIEVRRDYQGSGLVQDLFNAIERWGESDKKEKPKEKSRPLG